MLKILYSPKTISILGCHTKDLSANKYLTFEFLSFNVGLHRGSFKEGKNWAGPLMVTHTSIESFEVLLNGGISKNMSIFLGWVFRSWHVVEYQSKKH